MPPLIFLHLGCKRISNPQPYCWNCFCWHCFLRIVWETYYCAQFSSAGGSVSSIRSVDRIKVSLGPVKLLNFNKHPQSLGSAPCVTLLNNLDLTVSSRIHHFNGTRSAYICSISWQLMKSAVFTELSACIASLWAINIGSVFCVQECLCFAFPYHHLLFFLFFVLMNFVSLYIFSF